MKWVSCPLRRNGGGARLPSARLIQEPRGPRRTQGCGVLLCDQRQGWERRAELKRDERLSGVVGQCDWGAVTLGDGGCIGGASFAQKRAPNLEKTTGRGGWGG